MTNILFYWQSSREVKKNYGMKFNFYSQYRENLKNGTLNCFYFPKTVITWFYSAVTCPNDAEREWQTV